MRLAVLFASLALSPGSAVAVSAILKPLPLSAACQKAGYSALQDASGTLRALRYLRTVPDHSLRQAQYYSASGQLQSLKSSASGFAGVLYDLTVRLDARGNVAGETGYRSRLFKGEVPVLPVSVASVRAGRCTG